MDFIIRELQNLQSIRRGTEIQAKNLTQAKIAASRSAVFQRTVLTITSLEGELIAYKRDGVWHYAPDTEAAEY